MNNNNIEQNPGGFTPEQYEQAGEFAVEQERREAQALQKLHRSDESTVSEAAEKVASHLTLVKGSRTDTQDVAPETLELLDKPIESESQKSEILSKLIANPTTGFDMQEKLNQLYGADSEETELKKAA